MFKNLRGSEWIKCDLHMHSNASDGKSTVYELIDEAQQKELSVIALTDHHTVDNIDEAKAYGASKNITVISGIEFRTEYGQKSVHMIGLFPDEYNDIKLNQNNLYDLILSKLNLSKSTIIQAGKRVQPDCSDDQAYKEGLLRVQVSFKDAADLIHEFGGIVSVHAGGKANSFDEEMKHEGSSPKNVDLIDSLGTVKEDLLQNYIDICEVRNNNEVDFYLKNWNKPCIVASDAHATNEVGQKKCWIKCEPTFEGLKQIIYEPADRVRIQDSKPEQKADYLVIDSIRIQHKDFGNQLIPLNSGLNTIIGGRSSGKSILLGCIARLCGYSDKIKNNKSKYDDYILSISSNSSITWRDARNVSERKIDFFPQGYIIDMASKSSRINELVEKIIRDDDTVNNDLNIVNGKVEVIKVNIHQLFSEYRKKREEQLRIEEELHALGEKEGVEFEISKIENIISEIKSSIKCDLSDEYIQRFEKNKKEVEMLQKSVDDKKICIGIIETLKGVHIMDDISHSINSSLDDSIKKEIVNEYEQLKKITEKKWYEIVEKQCKKVTAKMEEEIACVERIKSDTAFINAQRIYEENSKLTKENEKYEKEKSKLNLIQQLALRIETIKSDINNIKEQIFNQYNEFYSTQSLYCDTHSINKEDVVITPQVVFEAEEFYQIISKNFDGRNSINANVLYYKYDASHNFLCFMKSLLNELLDEKYVLRTGITSVNIAEEIFSRNPFSIKYNINYQGDDLASMSEGKTAFVILRMILDFSKSEYPILIDQPEDDLDNRAIFSDLVKYLRQKKTQRQIILVTHNPNIVVGADAEEIIVANQNGVNNENPDNIKFSYISGALENSFVSDTNEILNKQGIREHVCDILEGGDKAFRLREQKYQFR